MNDSVTAAAFLMTFGILMLGMAHLLARMNFLIQERVLKNVFFSERFLTVCGRVAGAVSLLAAVYLLIFGE